MHNFKTLSFRTKKLCNIIISRVESKILVYIVNYIEHYTSKNILTRRAMSDKNEICVTMLSDNIFIFSFTYHQFETVRVSYRNSQ